MNVQDCRPQAIAIVTQFVTHSSSEALPEELALVGRCLSRLYAPPVASTSSGRLSDTSTDIPA